MAQISTSSTISGRDSLMSLLKDAARLAEGKSDISAIASTDRLAALDSPATRIDLSDRAQAVISRLEKNQDVADQLQKIVAGGASYSSILQKNDSVDLLGIPDNKFQNTGSFEGLQFLKNALSGTSKSFF